MELSEEKIKEYVAMKQESVDRKNWKKLPLLSCGKLAPNHILISRKKPLKVYQERVHFVFFNMDEESVYLQATGAAVPQAIELALQTQEKYANI